MTDDLQAPRARVILPRFSSAAPLVGLVALVALFIVTGVRGVDFGFHWDENLWHVDRARAMVTGGIFLPHFYYYPSLGEWIGLAPSLPNALAAAIAAKGDPESIQAAMKAVVDPPQYLLTVRIAYIVISSLALAWIYGAVVALGRRPWEALVAAACLGLSWEYAYHSRWVANDCILTQFGALMLFMLALFQRLKRPLWLSLATVAVGLATGAKQQGLFLLLPLIVVSVSSRPWAGPRQHLARVAGVCAIAFAVFVATTPGVLLEPFAFIHDARKLTSIYAAARGGYTVSGMGQHWRLVLTYLCVVLFSPFHAVAIVMFGATVWGGIVWMRRDRRFGVVLLAFPLGFLAIFCAKYVVMIARNYLIVAPFLCILAARGVADVFEALERKKLPWARGALAAALAATAVVQGLWLIRAGESIRHIDNAAYVRDAFAYVTGHPATQFRVSDSVRAIAAGQHLTLPPNVTAAPNGQAVVMFGRADNGPLDRCLLNDPWLTEAVFGPREVNYDWYATWAGHDRIVIMTLEKARLSLVPLAR
jgi:Dolichyl-phosphate-mannose-protein mannosyltransferase